MKNSSANLLIALYERLGEASISWKIGHESQTMEQVYFIYW